MSQPTNPTAINNISTDFQKRAETQFQLSMVYDLIMSMRGLRGFWPQSVVSSTPTAIDTSGNGLHLTRNSTVSWNRRGIAPYVIFPGGAVYLTRADAADIETLGNEAWYPAGAQGMTIGGWFKFVTPANGMTMISKRGAVNNYGYRLYLNAALQPTFDVSGDGVNEVSVSHTTAIVTDQWHFIWASFDASTKITVALDGVLVNNAVGTPAALFDNNVAFQVSGWNGNNNTMVGYSSLDFLAATTDNEALLWTIYQYSKHIFG